MSDDELREMHKNGPRCPECPLYKTGIFVHDHLPDPIWPHKSKYSGLTLIGEMPGSSEVKSRTPFTGPSGRLLWAICEAVGVPKEELHCTNAIRCGLPQGAKPRQAEGDLAIECCRPFIYQVLGGMSTKVVCALGAVALQSFSGLKGINKFRGTVLPPIDEEPWMITSTLHPAGLLNTEATRILVENVRFDIKKAYDLAKGASPWEPIVADASNAEDLIEFMHNIAVEDVVAVDVETTGINAFTCGLVTIGIATATSCKEEAVAWAIPWAPAFPGFYTAEEWEEIRYYLVDLLTTKGQRIVFHNFTFDVPVLENHLGIEITASVQDTLLLDHAAYPKLPHNLQSVASRYLAVEPWKTDFRASEKELDKTIDKEMKALDTALGLEDPDEAVDENLYKGAVHVEKLNEQAVAELFYYNASDAAATWKIYWPLLQETHELNTNSVYQQDMRLAACALHWTEDGIGIDLEERARLDIKFSAELKEMKAELRTMCKLPAQKGIDTDVGYWQDMLDDAKETSKTIRKVCCICEKKCASGPKLQEHIKKEHDGHERATENLEALAALEEDVKEARFQIKRMRKVATTENFNPASPIQLRRVFLNRGLTPLKVTKKTLEVSTAKDSLWELRDDEFVNLLFRWRSLAKLHSTYVRNLEAKLGADGRLHPQWKLHSTPSGRFGTTPSAANWPKSMRELMVASDGCKIVGADYAALELRIIALLAGQEDLIEAFMTDADIHARHAGWFFPTVWPEIQKKWENAADNDKERNKLVPEYKQLRGAGKPITFGKNYRAGPQTLYETVREERPDVKTPAENKRLLQEVTEMSRILDSRYANIVTWSDMMTVKANEDFCLYTELDGRIRKWPMGKVPATEAANHPVQGLAADIMNRATLRLAQALKDAGIYRNGAWIILQIHDALYLEVEEHLALQVAKMLEEAMETELTITSAVTGKEHTMRFPAEADIGDNVAEV